MGSLVDITLVDRWNVGRVSDAVLFMLGNCGLRSLVSMLDALPMVVLVSRLLLSGVIYPARNSVATYKPVAAAVSTKPPFFLNKIYMFSICLILLRGFTLKARQKKKKSSGTAALQFYEWVRF